MKATKNPLRIVLRTSSGPVLDTRVCELELEDLAGRFTVRANDDAVLTALVPGEIVLRKADKTELRVQIDWGSLTKVGREARLVVDHAEVIGEPSRMPIAV